MTIQQLFHLLLGLAQLALASHHPRHIRFAACLNVSAHDRSRQPRSLCLRDSALPQLNVRLMQTRLVLLLRSISELDSNSNSSTGDRGGSSRGLFWTSLTIRRQEHLRMDFKSLIHGQSFDAVHFHDDKTSSLNKMQANACVLPSNFCLDLFSAARGANFLLCGVVGFCADGALSCCADDSKDSHQVLNFEP